MEICTKARQRESERELRVRQHTRLLDEVCDLIADYMAPQLLAIDELGDQIVARVFSQDGGWKMKEFVAPKSTPTECVKAVLVLKDGLFILTSAALFFNTLSSSKDVSAEHRALLRNSLPGLTTDQVKGLFWSITASHPPQFYDPLCPGTGWAALDCQPLVPLAAEKFPNMWRGLVVDTGIWVWDRFANRLSLHDFASLTVRFWNVPFLDTRSQTARIYYSPPNKIVLEDDEHCCYLDKDHPEHDTLVTAPLRGGLLWKGDKRIRVLCGVLIAGGRQVPLGCPLQDPGPACLLF